VTIISIFSIDGLFVNNMVETDVGDDDNGAAIEGEGEEEIIFLFLYLYK
jgi:hypothetical protein